MSSLPQTYEYNVTLDVLGDLFDVIFFCGGFVEIDELWIYDQIIYEYYLSLF